MALRSGMQHNFSMVPSANIPRSKIQRNHRYKTTFDSGYLVPIFRDEVLPGDTFSLRASLFARLSTPIVPIMDDLYLDTFFFFVPIRLIYKNWQKLHGEQENPGDSTDYLVPQLPSPSGGWGTHSLSDYFGLPLRVPNLSVCAFYHRAYNLIYNEWFRHQDLQDSVAVPTGDGPDTNDNYKLLRRTKRYDYFTSCLPWPQKGPGVELPIGTTANLNLSAPTGSVTITGNGAPRFAEQSFSGITTAANFRKNTNAGSSTVGLTAGTPTTAGEGISWHDPKLKATLTLNPISGTADLTGATAVTINSLRQAFQIQKLLERDARGGTRYTEVIRSHFGVVSPDSRLQRPEYLGGSSSRIHINPVVQNSASNDTSPQGNLAAFGVVRDEFHGFTKSFTEHGVILGLVNVRADLTYQQGIPRQFSRETRFDYYYPALAHIGEQAVLNKEIYAQGTEADEAVFGYIGRWDEYRHFPSAVTGKFRSTDPQTLDFWHLAQKFENLPALNPEFIEERPPVKRTLAVQDEPEFIFDSFFQMICARPMPTYSVPGFIDHF